MRIKWNSDALGVCAAMICLVHCLVWPAILLATPWLARWQAESRWLSSDPWFHVTALVVVVPIGLIGVTSGWRRHGRIRPTVLAGFGLALLLGAMVFGTTLGGTGAQYASVLGSLAFIAAHTSNRRASPCCNSTAAKVRPQGAADMMTR